MKVIPTGDRVIIKMLETETVTKGGIVLAGTAKEKPQIAEVVSVGENTKIEVGSRVLINKYAGSEFKIDDQLLLILKEIDIIAIVEMEENA
jgi:chaperonin GroES